MRRQIKWRWLLLVAAVLLARAAAGADTPNHCLECHSQLDPPVGVSRDSYATDIHAQRGMTCASCHGGDPAKEDDQAMSKAAGFRGKIERKQVPEVCGKCHSDAAYIHGYNPSLRTDQYAQYQTSVHGKQLAKGDTHVAVCTDCHSVHGIRPATDPRSTVNPLNVAKTCSQCHADAGYMKGYKLSTDQFAGYSASAHHAAMTERGDLSAPTCTTCHGNHGAAPPGVASVENVCSTCHVFQAQLFDKSPHKQAFASAGLPSCVTCHKNHRVVHPTDASLGAGPTSYCTDCHTQGDLGYTAAVTMQRDLNGLERAITDADVVLTSAEQSGMEVSQAKLELAQARDALTKARVSVHAFQSDGLGKDIAAGTKVAAETRRAGLQALQERDYRRMGLGVSLLTIVLVLVGLGFYIREIERNGGTSH